MVIVVAEHFLCTTAQQAVAFRFSAGISARQSGAAVQGKGSWSGVELKAFVFIMSLVGRGTSHFLSQVLTESEVISVREGDRAEVIARAPVLGSLSTTRSEVLESGSAALGNFSWYLGRKLAFEGANVEMAGEQLTDAVFVQITHDGKRAAVSWVCV